MNYRRAIGLAAVFSELEESINVVRRMSMETKRVNISQWCIINCRPPDDKLFFARGSDKFLEVI